MAPYMDGLAGGVKRRTDGFAEPDIAAVGLILADVAGIKPK